MNIRLKWISAIFYLLSSYLVSEFIYSNGMVMVTIYLCDCNHNISTKDPENIVNEKSAQQDCRYLKTSNRNHSKTLKKERPRACGIKDKVYYRMKRKSEMKHQPDEQYTGSIRKEEHRALHVDFEKELLSDFEKERGKLERIIR